MKIVSNLLENIDGIEIWYIAGLLIFFIMFLLFVVRTLIRPRKEMEEIKNALLDDQEETDHKTSI